jgi:poly(A) polymerase
MELNQDRQALVFFEAWIAEKFRSGIWLEKTFGVGGFFRDQLLGREPYDLDLVVEAPGGAEKIARLIADEFPQSISSPHQMGKSYPIWELSFKGPLSFGGRTFDLSGVSVQIADTQKESFMEAHSRQRVTSYGSLPEDCARRDFTVNMLYWDLREKKMVDPSGCGIRDLQAKILKTHPGVIAEKIFSDDPLRILRMFRFQAQLGFSIDPETLRAARQTSERISILSFERIRDELNKAAVTCGLAPMIRSMESAGVLDKVLPEALAMKGCAQDKIYHAEGDVFLHTLMVMEAAPKTVVLQWAAFLHDFGKPNTQSFEGERIKFIGHEIFSESIGRIVMERLVFPRELIEAVMVLIRFHLRGGDATQWKTAKPARKLLRELGPHADDWWDLVVADSNSSLSLDGKPRLEHLPILRKYLDEASRVPISKKPLLSGEIIMQELGLSPGKRVGELLLMSAEIEDDFVLSNRPVTVEAIVAELRLRIDSIQK